jgi:D-sedoheptulose 7-phosphate isomerase
MSSFEKHIAKSIINKKKLIKLEKKINIVIKKMHECLSSNNKIFICGNGGSAADAQHVSTEFLVRLKPNLNRKSFPIICLGNDMTYLTACSNDLGFDKVFSRNLSALHKNDEKNILICLSTSGNSKNILEVLNLAKKLGVYSISFLGGNGGKASKLSGDTVIIPSKNTANIQEEHIFILHYILENVEKKLI